jgi:hypothetical protein
MPEDVDRLVWESPLNESAQLVRSRRHTASSAQFCGTYAMSSRLKFIIDTREISIEFHIAHTDAVEAEKPVD